MQLSLEDIVIEVRCLALPEQEMVDTLADSLGFYWGFSAVHINKWTHFQTDIFE